jgi:hypothetical protein
MGDKEEGVRGVPYGQVGLGDLVLRPARQGLDPDALLVDVQYGKHTRRGGRRPSGEKAVARSSRQSHQGRPGPIEGVLSITLVDIKARV